VAGVLTSAGQFRDYLSLGPAGAFQDMEAMVGAFDPSKIGHWAESSTHD